MFHLDPDGAYRSSLLSETPWIEHGFGTRHFPAGLDGPQVATLQQIHSATAILVSGVDGCVGEADALITAAPGQRVAVRTADCIPVLIASLDRKVVAAIHAGWRGTSANIAGLTVERIRREFGGDPASLVAAIGPGIGPCCYEVGAEVADRFRRLFPVLAPNKKAFLDLSEANRLQLRSAGIGPERIDIAGLCTRCRSHEFFSYRHDPLENGRMQNVIGIVG